MPAKKLNAQQQRDRRAKILLGVLGVLLVAILGFELPGLLGGAKHSSPPAAPTVTSDAGTSAPSSDSLASFQVVATPQPSHLRAFGRFASKDPFHAPASASQPSGSSAASTASGGGGAPAAKTTTATTTPATPTTTPSVTFTAPATTATQPEGPMVLAAVLRMNGVRRVIPLGSAFPAANPVFKLVAVGRKAMWVSLLRGSFGGGQQTLKIVLDHPVKLVNMTVGLDYVLRLVRMTAVPKSSLPVVTPPPTTTSAATTTGTTAAATTTSGP